MMPFTYISLMGAIRLHGALYTPRHFTLNDYLMMPIE
jgi:hypothetical protein